MTKALDIRELIAEQSSGPAERKAMEAMAEVLHESLAPDVPPRPEFQIELRRQLMAEARRMLTPWYRRPSVWGSSIAVAAAAVVLAVGLQMYRTGPVRPNGIAGTGTPGDVHRVEHGTDPFKVNYTDLKLPVVAVPDELVSAQTVPGTLAGLDVATGLRIFVVQAQPDMEQFKRVAAGLGFAQQPQQAGGEFRVAEGNRVLTMTVAGQVIYMDRSALQEATGPAIDAADARDAARRFLDRASLPVPDLQPNLAESGQSGARLFTVTYTPRVEGRPVVNSRTVIQLTGRNMVARAEAYVHAKEEPLSKPGKATQPQQAVTAAQQSGGARFGPDVDLVYVRTAHEQAVYLQPYWRVFGTDAQGRRLARYIPALAQ